MASLSLLAILCHAALLLQLAAAFNIEIREVSRKVGPPGARFGSSVSFHSTTTTITEASNSILVGAPYANRTLPLNPSGGMNLQTGFENEQPGAVYQCDGLTDAEKSSSTDCVEVGMDYNDISWWPYSDGNENSGFKVSYSGPIYLRDHALFGHTVVSAGPGQSIMACGPNTRVFRPIFGASGDRGAEVFRAAGSCVQANSTINFESLKQVKFCFLNVFTSTQGSTSAWPCNGGISATYSKVTPTQSIESFIVGGASGSQLHSGFYDPISLRLPKNMPLLLRPNNDFILVSREPGGLASVSAIGSNIVPDSDTSSPTAEIRPVLYAGSPKGQLNSSQGLAHGFVKAVQLSVLRTTGVELSWNVQYLGEQIDAGFGSSLVVGTFDGDAGSDLVVGAPYFVDYSVPGNFENGRLSFISSRHIQANWRQIPITDDSSSTAKFIYHDRAWTGENRARLGFALANIGDTNRDGYDELAVGAPGINTVYVYYGRPEGPTSENVQVIRASEIARGSYASVLQGFGSAIGTTQTGSLPWDMDMNGYTDIVVGAPNSDSVVFLKARPVAHLQATFNFMPPSINFVRCLNDTTLPYCFSAEVCFSVDGTASTNVLAARPVRANLSVCEGDSNGRCVTTQRLAASTWTLANGMTPVLNSQTRFDIPITGGMSTETPLCFRFNATLVNNIEDRLGPIRLVANWTVEDIPTKDFSSLTPVGTRFGKQNDVGTLNVDKDCRLVTCMPDMYISDTTVTLSTNTQPDHIVVGRDVTATVVISVGNRNEPGTAPVVTAVLPLGVTLSGQSQLCTASTSSNGENIVTCALENPFARNATASVGFTVSMISIPESSSELLFNASVLANTLSTPENASLLEDNYRNVTLALLREAGYQRSGTFQQGGDITLTGGKFVDEVMEPADYGPEISHRFSLLNVNGPSTLPMTVVQFEYPTVVKNTDTYLMYLTEVRPLGQNVSCNIDGLVNPLGHELSTPDTSSPVPTLDPRLGKQQDCNNGSIFYCTQSFECTFGQIASGGATSLQMFWRLYNRTVIQHATLPLLLTLGFVVKSVTPADNFTLLTADGRSPTTTYHATLRVQNPTTVTSESVNIGVIVGAAVGGLAVVIIIIIILWKCGFFKREKLDEMQAASGDSGGGGKSASGAGEKSNTAVSYVAGSDTVHHQANVQSDV